MKILILIWFLDEKCGKDRFICDGEKKCLGMIKLCDGVADCKDGTDENNCGMYFVLFDFQSRGECATHSQIYLISVIEFPLCNQFLPGVIFF